MNYTDLSPVKRSSVTFTLSFSVSQVAAYLILLIGSVYAFWVKDATTLLATFSAVSAILMTKTYVQGKTNQAVINNSTTTSNNPQ